jgi:ankyrin repeat protein
MFRAAGLLLLIPLCHAAEPSPEAIRGAATRAVALLQKSQQSWFTQHQCASCHHQVLPAIAFRDARSHGIPVDEAAAHADAAKSFASYADLDRAIQYTHQIDSAMDDGYRMIAAQAAGVRPSLTTAIYARHLAVRQQPDGHWATNDGRPPQSYSFITTTAVAARALMAYGRELPDYDERAARARHWLAAQKPTCTEERVHQLLGLLWTNASGPDRKRLAEALAAQQRDDGGWNSVAGRESDAYSTGQALVAMRDGGGVPVTDPHWQRGVRYLLQTQAGDGSWHVVSRLMPPVQVSPPFFETGYPYGHDQFISAMGASWAIRALVRALGPASDLAPPPPLKEAEPAAEPWMNTVLFGNAADLKKLLASGWNPNSATSKGTTALMMTMPDVEKARLLVEHGADVNARSKSRYSALLVAALYPNGDEAAKFLLARGAQTTLPPGGGAPLFGATGMSVAVNSGNARLVPIFAARGENPVDRYTIIGMFPAVPALAPVTMDDTATLQALLDTGLPVDTADDDNLTLLDWAVIYNRPGSARLLIAHSADVNHMDKFGMTPLQHAASIDFGDAEMITLLRKSGAKADPKALDLARKYRHQNLLHALGAN